MIIVRLAGGLGNQMFQYAFGRFLAERNKEELLLDCSLLRNNLIHPNSTFREFEMDIFKIKGKIAEPSEIYKLRPSIFFRIYNRISRRINLPYLSCSRYLQERKQFHYRSFEKVSNCVVEGNWQNEKYFSSIEAIIRDDFKFYRSLSSKNKNLLEKIENVCSISLHIRRGDFANNPNTFQTHGLCSLEYYKKAVNFMVQRVEKPVFFIFSDEIEWAKANLNLKYNCEFVTENIGKESYIDMQLMSFCKHNIIANSTFSWWGAWLNKNPNKIVIAPKQWFLNENLNKFAKNLIPEKWIRL